MADLGEKLRRQRAPSRSSSSPLSPWAWKASLFFWRRLLKKNSPKPHVIKPSITASLPHWPSCKRGKSSSTIPMKHYTNNNSNFFYYSSPNHTTNDNNTMPSGMYGYYNAVTTKTRSRPSSGRETPMECNYSPNLSHMNHNTLPYFQLRHSPSPPPSSTLRLPLYIVS